jgi:hypothetical protein
VQVYLFTSELLKFLSIFRARNHISAASFCNYPRHLFV